MTEFVNEINYDKLIEKALKQVVVEALKIAETQGLPGENHFYITFRTNHPGTIIPRDLLIQYPDSMTIVLQHQYSNLEVGTDSFSVELSFGGRPQTLVVPYEAITYFDYLSQLEHYLNTHPEIQQQLPDCLKNKPKYGAQELSMRPAQLKQKPKKK